MSGQAHRALEKIVDEVRAESTVEGVDWDRVEAGLEERLARQGSARPLPARERSVAVAVALAASLFGGAFALVELGRSGPDEPRADAPPVAGELAPAGAATEAPFIDGEALSIGRVVSAEQQPRVVQHPGRATWIVEPHASARLAARGDAIVVVLERGAVAADVVPGGGPGRFVVLAGGTRVSVEGTVFRVERTASGVHVRVDRGVVSVGPTNGGPVTRVRAPQAAAFDLSGHPEAPPSGPAGKSRPSKAGAPKPPAAGSSAPEAEAIDGGQEAPSTEAPAATKPPAADLKTLASIVQGVVQQCFTENTPPRGDIRISAQTKMLVDVRANGRIELAEFQPPLAPAVEACVADRLHRVTLDVPAGRTRIEQTVTLVR